MHGIGTASSEWLELCGLGSIQKSITLCFIPNGRKKILLAEMNQALSLHKKGTGIAVSIPMNGMQGFLYKLLNEHTAESDGEEVEKEVKKMSEPITHAMILVTINQGYSDAVMNTARAAGATGGTILKGLRCSPGKSAVIFGITAIACFGTAGAFTSGGVIVAADMTVLSAIGDLALGAIAVTGWCSAAVTAVFGWLTAAGASRMKAAKTLELYADTAEGFDWHKGLSLSMLADLTHKKKTKALKMLRKFIHKGWLSAWLDEKNDKLYLTAEDYRAAQENQPQPEPEKAPEQAGEVPLNLETTRRFAQVLEKEQGLMEDERAVEELQHMQKTTESICAWLEAHPESLPKARRFAEYYIPTTLKLLHTYNDVQSQQGENAEAIRRDIAGILHTLNQAYDNLYDKLLSDVALDVSSEIAALQGMLANDGLAGEGLR